MKRDYDQTRFKSRSQREGFCPMDDYSSQNNQSHNDQWDRWNSSSANSSYYNQPVHKPYGQSFSLASFILGVLSVTLGCCGISLPLSALGILFALLVYRKGQKLNSTAKSGLVLSCIGALVGVCSIVYVILAMPNLMQQMEEWTQLEEQYGSDSYTEFLERYYDYLSDYYEMPENQ